MKEKENRAAAPTFIKSTAPDSNECKICKVYKVEVNRTCYHLITLKSVPRPDGVILLFSCLSMEVKPKNTLEERMTIKYNELRDIPCEDIYSGVVNVCTFSLSPLILSH